jgi:hypothetical protein
LGQAELKTPPKQVFAKGFRRLSIGLGEGVFEGDRDMGV